MATEATVAVPAAAATENILKRSVALVLRCGRQGNNRRVELGGVEMTKDGETLDREKDEMGATKRLFSKGDLKQADAAIDAVKSRLRSLSVDGGTKLFGPGTYLLPLLAVPQALDVLRDGKAQVAERAEELVGRLPRMLEQRAQKLGPLFDAQDYPTPDELRAAYRVDWTFVAFQTPEQLETVDAAAYAQAKAEQDARLSSAYEDVIVGLRQSALLVMRELAERLRPGADGKPKVLRATALRDLQDLLERLPVLNSIGEDDALADSLARVGVVSRGIDVEMLREAPAVRAMLLETAEKTIDKLDELVTSGRRAFAL